MSVTRMPTLQPAEARLMRWVALAVLLHVALLLVPAKEETRHGDALKSLRIALSTTVSATPDRAKAADPQPATAAVPEPAAPAPVTQPMAPAPPIAGERPENHAPREADAARLSAARLFDLDGRREWRLNESAGQRRLGVITPQALPENWRSGIPYRTDPPSGRAAPDRLEIVDRWLAADGSHNVMVETPTGERLCGRAEAWDPLRPLVEPVMMFRSCGSAPGAFVWPERYDGGQRR